MTEDNADRSFVPIADKTWQRQKPMMLVLMTMITKYLRHVIKTSGNRLRSIVTEFS